jgi:photosystem II stability/assembly factor-like uncharacterized protein
LVEVRIGGAKKALYGELEMSNGSIARDIEIKKSSARLGYGSRMTGEASCCRLTPTQVGRHLMAITIAALVMTGCQARLDLSGVLLQQSQPIQRADLLQAAAANEDTIVAVGAMGIVITSEDRGANWQRTTIPGKPFLIDVSACSSSDFFAIDNAGALWARASSNGWLQRPLPEGTEPQALTCDESGTLWLVGGFGTIMSSGNGGGDWETSSLDDDIYLTTVQFVDSAHAYITGEFGTVLQTGDRGATWERVQDLPDNFYPQAAQFTDRRTGWIVGLNGTVLHTGDGGQTWNQEENDSNAPLYGVTSVGDGLVAVGDNATVLYRSPSRPHWVELERSDRMLTYLRGIVALSDDQFAAVGGGILFTSTLPQN